MLSEKFVESEVFDIRVVGLARLNDVCMYVYVTYVCGIFGVNTG